MHLTKRLLVVLLHADNAITLMDSSAHQSLSPPALTGGLGSRHGGRYAQMSSCTLPSAGHQRAPLLTLWHNWQTVRCRLTLLFQCGLVASTEKRKQGTFSHALLERWIDGLAPKKLL